jgi:hypothetical protein
VKHWRGERTLKVSPREPWRGLGGNIQPTATCGRSRLVATANRAWRGMAKRLSGGFTKRRT